MLKKIDKQDDLKEIEDNQSLISIQTILNDLQINPFGHYLIEVEDNQIIAYLYYSDIYERAEINQIEVEISHRNCGKASKLLKEMLKLVEKNITLEVKEDNFAAINLYKKFGLKKKQSEKGITKE